MFECANRSIESKFIQNSYVLCKLVIIMCLMCDCNVILSTGLGYRFIFKGLSHGIRSVRMAHFEAFTFEKLSLSFVIKSIGNIRNVEILPLLFWDRSAVSLISLFLVVLCSGITLVNNMFRVAV